MAEKKKGLDGKACWKGYKLAGTQKKGGKTVDNCVKEGKTFQQFCEEYKELKKSKVGMKAGKKIISAIGHAGKAGAEEEGTIENQIRMQKAGKKAKQADKMHDVSKKHNPDLSKLKSLKNKLTGEVKKSEKK